MATNSRNKSSTRSTGKSDLSLTLQELTHLRDLMSIMLPPEGKVTISAALAQLESRDAVDETLWDKVCDACETAGIDIGESAPNLIVAPSDIVPLGVFRFEPHEQAPEAPAKPKSTKKKAK